MARNQILLHILKLRQHIKYISLYIKRWRDAIKLVKNESEKNAILYCIYVYACCVYDCHPAECSFGAHDCLWICECTHTLAHVPRLIDMSNSGVVAQSFPHPLLFWFIVLLSGEHTVRAVFSLSLSHTQFGSIVQLTISLPIIYCCFVIKKFLKCANNKVNMCAERTERERYVSRYLFTEYVKSICDMDMELVSMVQTKHWTIRCICDVCVAYRTLILISSVL